MFYASEKIVFLRTSLAKTLRLTVVYIIPVYCSGWGGDSLIQNSQLEWVVL